MSEVITWVTFPQPAEFGKIPRWRRSAGRRGDGELFVPLAIVSSQEIVAVKYCVADGFHAALFRDHLFVPATWMRQKWPQFNALLDLIAEKTDQIMVAEKISQFMPSAEGPKGQ